MKQWQHLHELDFYPAMYSLPGAKKEIPKLSEGELRLTEDVPTSAVELRVKEKVMLVTFKMVIFFSLW